MDLYAYSMVFYRFYLKHNGGKLIIESVFSDNGVGKLEFVFTFNHIIGGSFK